MHGSRDGEEIFWEFVHFLHKYFDTILSKRRKKGRKEGRRKEGRIREKSGPNQER